MKIRNTIIVVISLAFMIAVVITQWDKVESLQWELKLEWFLLSLLAVVVLFFFDGYGWHLILKAMGSGTEGAKKSVIVWLLSSVTRYIPGGIWPYASRVTMAKDLGVDAATATVSLYLETLLLCASSFAVGLPALLMLTGVDITLQQACVILLLMGGLMHPKIISIFRFFPGKIGVAFARVKPPSIAWLLALYLYYVVFWIVFGFVFGLFISAIYPLSIENLMYVGSVLALSFCVGFVVIFIPGGIGVRESVMYLSLSTIMPSKVSLAIAVGSRIWVMMGEAISVLISLQLSRRKKNDSE